MSKFDYEGKSVEEILEHLGVTQEEIDHVFPPKHLSKPLKKTKADSQDKEKPLSHQELSEFYEKRANEQKNEFVELVSGTLTNTGVPIIFKGPNNE